MMIYDYETFLKHREAGTVHGVYEGVPNEVYHDFPALSSSQFNSLKKSDLHWKWEQEHPKERKPFFELGSALHVLTLENDKFNEQVVAMPKFDRRTKVGKANHAAFMEAHGDKVIIDTVQLEALLHMRGALQKREDIRAMMSMGRPELSIFGKMNGVLCRCRPDWLDVERGLVFDLKSSKDASEEAFVKAVYNYGYHRQAAFYLDLIAEVTGVRCRAYAFVVVENQPPYACNTFDLFGDFYGIGRATYEPLVDVYKRAKSGECIGYGQKIKTLIPKAWMFYEAEEMEGAGE